MSKRNPKNNHHLDDHKSNAFVDQQQQQQNDEENDDYDKNNKNKNHYTEQRVLSIQSHVVSGYVGNKAAVFPLQLLGYDVDVMNSVNFSNHTGYDHGFTGDVLSGTQLLNLLKGLQQNQLLTNIQHILTGYIGSESFLLAIVNVIQTIQQEQQQSQQHQSQPKGSSHQRMTTKRVRYVCDPVLGDHGCFYVPRCMVQLYQQHLLPLADVITPNQFEMEQLSSSSSSSMMQEQEQQHNETKKIRTLQDAIRACQIVHELGPPLIFITSLILEEEEEKNENGKTLSILASRVIKYNKKTTTTTTTTTDRSISSVHHHQEEQNQQPPSNNYEQEIWRITCPTLPGQFTGTGDVTAALLLAHTAAVTRTTTTDDDTYDDTNDDDDISSSIPYAMEKVMNTMYAMLERTNQLHHCSPQQQQQQQHQQPSEGVTTNTTKKPELKLIQCKDIIENPPYRFRAEKIQ